jgi:hypothetical protein
MAGVPTQPLLLLLQPSPSFLTASPSTAARCSSSDSGSVPGAAQSPPVLLPTPLPEIQQLLEAAVRQVEG